MRWLLTAFTITGILLPAWVFSEPGIVRENDQEFFATGDFDGDGNQDVAIIDRYSGRVRLGYQIASGTFDWADWRDSGVKYVASVTVGKLIDGKRDVLAFASADVNQVTLLDVSDPTMPSVPVLVPTTAPGPNVVTAIDIGGEGNTALDDLVVGSIYNTDDPPNRLSLFRNAGSAFNQISELPSSGPGAKANRIALKRGGGVSFVQVVTDDNGQSQLLVQNLSSGKPETVLTVSDVPADSDYVVGHFRGSPLVEFVFYKPGEAGLTVWPVEEAGGKFRVAAAKKLELPRPPTQLIAVGGETKSRLLAIFGTNEPAELMDFDAANLPVTVQSLHGSTNKSLSAAIALPDSVLLLSSLMAGRASTHYQSYVLESGRFEPGSMGGLPSLADRDETTVPEIRSRIVAALKEKSPGDMKPYTNTIPGTDVTYSMVVIPGGEFLMGSPETEKGRKSDEGPQHRVKISPFWMGQFEVTWDQYLLFMYPDDEKKLREVHPTSDEINRLSDAVTRPSKPYVDMTFGMGKSGFPAISMTQHAANKFCHWLSAKTGHFYRLPTEAEWEYACRAGTTTSRYFGDDESQLEEHAWFFDNSNSKYQLVGKKKPNPWGLYDMYGNVTEWVLDQYDPEFYSKAGSEIVIDPWNKATQPYPHSVRGGSWDDDPPALRSAARRGSSRNWKMTDPQLPKSIWYHSDAQFVGFRIVRPLAVPSAEEMQKYWSSGVEKD